MKRKPLVILTTAAFIFALSLNAVAQFDSPVVKKWTVKEKNDKGKEVDVEYMTLDGVMVHETDPAKQPQPPVVTPGTESTQETPGLPPSDAVVLFNGKDLSSWTDSKGNPTKWVVQDGVMLCTADSGMIRTKDEFGSCQLHVEWAAPTEVEDDGQGRGNSGVFVMGQYEIQVLDCYNNQTYPDGQAGAIYGRSKPLVNACRKPGEWQSYDIIFHRPIFDGDKVVKRATFTVLHNGVLIQDHYELTGGTDWRGGHSISEYAPHGDTGPVMFQDHGNPVRYRNVWIRELKD